MDRARIGEDIIYSEGKMKSFFICPSSGQRLFQVGDKLQTSSGTVYPIIDDIPVLIPEYKKHLERIEQLKNSPKSSWYSQNQVDYYDHGPYRHHLNRRKRVVQSWVKECCSELLGSKEALDLAVLDHGCGDGASSRWLDSSLPPESSFLLTDYNFDRIIRARNLLGREGKTYFLSDVTRCPLEAGFLDLVFSNHVIEHICDDQSLLNEIYRILKPGGYLILGCPNEGVFFWILAYALSPCSLRNSDHIHFYNNQILIDKCKRAKLTHKKTVYLGYGVPHWSIDKLIRRFRAVDELFHIIGKAFFPRQSSSLYLLFRKE